MTASADGGLDCSKLVELVTDYLESALPEDERTRFEVHLESCEACRRFVEQMREIVRLASLVCGEYYSRSRRSASQALWRARSSS
jgi:anti-sigma factor RsiW